MAIKRNASAHWEGSGKEGKGTLTTHSGVLTDTQYSFNTRFEDGIGTNPEELLGAAHAGCFSMKLAFVLQSKGVTADSIETAATVVLDGGVITEVNLQTVVTAAGISAEDFAAAATEAKENCPVSQLFKAAITLDAKLV
jgi:osmotically inducible protein OsmC